MTRNDDDDEINDPARSDGIATIEEYGQHHQHHHRHHQYRTQHRHQYQPVHSRGSHQQIEEIDSNNQPILNIDEALELNEIGFYHYRLLVLCGFAWMADALELNLLSYLASCAGVEFNLSEAEKAAITSVAFAGVIVGTSICGMVSDRYGRRIGFLSATFLTSIGGLLTAFSTSYSMLLISRVIVGLGIGGGNIPFDLLAELLPHQKRGGFLVFIEYFWTFGSALVSLMAWLVLDKYGWRELALITMIPVIITSFFAMYYIPESPRWLLVMQRKEEAEEVIRDSMKCNGMIQLPSFRLKSIDTSPSSSPSHHHHNHNPHHHSPAWYRQIYQDISTIVREKVTFPLWIVWMSFGFGYYGFILYISRIYSKNNNQADQDQEAVSACSFDYSNIFYNSLSEVIGVTLCIFLLEYVGRVKIQSVAYTITGLSVFLMGFDLPSKWLLMMIGMVGRMGIMIASEVTWVHTPELYSTNHRTFAHAICVSFSKIGAFFAPFIIVSNLPLFAVGIILALVNLAGTMAVMFLPETTGLQLGDLDERNSRNDPADPSEGDDDESDGIKYKGISTTENILHRGNNLKHGHGYGLFTLDDEEILEYETLTADDQEEEMTLELSPMRKTSI